jgi:sugar phosphate permease
LSSIFIARLGWQAAFYIPGIIALAASVILFVTLRDRPVTLGLPDIEEYREPEAHEAAKEKKAKHSKMPYGEVFKKYILFNRTLWLLAFANVFVYVIRFGTEDWLIKYLVESKGNTLETAGIKLSFLPLCGILGSISCGYISDKVFGGRRAPINIIFLVGVILAILGLNANAAAPNFIDAAFESIAHQSLASTIALTGGDLMDMVFLGLMGLFTYGPQVLVGGICAVEASSKEVASASTGFTGCFGYLGAVLSAAGTGYLIDQFHWQGAIYFWIFSAVACILLCLPMINDKPRAA